MIQTKTVKVVTDSWEYSPEDIERLILEDIFDKETLFEGKISLKFEVGQNFDGATVTHTYTEIS